MQKIMFFLFSWFLILCSCEPKTDKAKKDYSFEYVNLNNQEIDSIYNYHSNDIVFLSFYPGMHNDIYRKYLKIEKDNRNLTFGSDANKDFTYYSFELDLVRQKIHCLAQKMQLA